MAERNEKTKRRPDLLTLLAGIAALVVSGYVLSDGRMWLPNNPTWLLAGGALLVGVLMLGSSLRGGRRDK